MLTQIRVYQRGPSTATLQKNDPSHARYKTRARLNYMHKLGWTLAKRYKTGHAEVHVQTSPLEFRTCPSPLFALVHPCSSV